MTNKIIKQKNKDYEEIASQSESEDEEKKLQDVKKEELTVGELFKYEEKLEKFNEQLAIEKEELRKEQQLDPYLEKYIEA